MESLVDEGLVKHIGFSNVGKTLIEQVFSYAKVKPSVIQNEMHPYLTQEELLKASKGAGLVPMAYSPFGSLSYVELGDATVEESVLQLSAVKDIAVKHSKTPAATPVRASAPDLRIPAPAPAPAASAGRGATSTKTPRYSIGSFKVLR